MNRITFLIDGFNLYHSLCCASKDSNGTSTKWLDLRGLCSGYLHIFGQDAVLEDIYYFSALAEHLDATNPGVTKRHKSYIECLRATGVTTEISRFKKKEIRCPYCKEKHTKYEEKETDVSLALKLLELFVADQCDTAVLVTGDTDLAPAYRTAKNLFSGKKVVFAFPYKRKNKELAKLAPGSFEISRKKYGQHQFPNPVIALDQSEVFKPENW
ncbi:MAG: NYN domain-containing protein [Elainellaceae cyanobacterium]